MFAVEPSFVGILDFKRILVVRDSGFGSISLLKDSFEISLFYMTNKRLMGDGCARMP